MASAITLGPRPTARPPRKILRNSLSSLFTEQEIRNSGTDPALRPEQVSVAQFIALAGLLAKDSE